jgi:hypothetical protein
VTRRAALLVAALAAARPLDAGDLFGGYSSLRSSGDNVRGAGAALTWRSDRPLRYTVELSGQFGQAAGESFDALSVLAGPALGFRSERRVRPFVHARAGAVAARRQVVVFGVAIGPDGVCDGGCAWQTGPVAEAGGGLDVRVGSRLWLRVPQVDYRWMRLQGRHERGLRLSAGIVYRLP